MNGVPEGLKRHSLLQPLAGFIVHGEFAIHSFIHPSTPSFIRLCICSSPSIASGLALSHIWELIDRTPLLLWSQRGGREGGGEILLCAQIISNEA